MPQKSEKKASPPPERRVVRRAAAPRVVRNAYDPSTPIALVAETLDHTGENIATLGARSRAQ